MRVKGLEPIRLSTLDPKSSAATNYATPAFFYNAKLVFFTTANIQLFIPYLQTYLRFYFYFCFWASRFAPLRAPLVRGRSRRAIRSITFALRRKRLALRWFRFYPSRSVLRTRVSALRASRSS